MAAGLEALLDFLDDTDVSEHYEKDGLHTPRIDEVLQRHKEPLTKKSAAVTQNDHTSNDRLLVIEKQLSELLEKNQNMKASNNTTSRRQPHVSRVSTRGESPMNDESGNSTSPVKGTRERRRKVGKYLGKENTKPTATLCNSKGMEEERERRWKAEQAAIKLAEHVRTLQIQIHQHQQQHDLVVVQSSKLESSLIKERGNHSKLKQERESIQTSHSETVKELKILKKKSQEQTSLLRDLERHNEKLENERIEYNQKLRTAEIQSATNEREAFLKEQLATRLQQQIHDLQELFATREREHMKELDRLKPLDNCNMRSMVEKEVEKETVRMESLVNQYKERLDQQMKSYRDLEEEFRTGLRIEAARYQQLENGYEKMATELVTCQESLETLKEKETKATSIVNELSTIVKEQKGRIIELSSGRQDLLRELREKTKLLQEESRTRCKIEERATVTHEENNRLSAKLSAHESVITGLREERKLWGHELALQGSSLAQDRGEMKGQIDSLNREIKELVDKLEHSNSSLRVKDKVIENETQTIKSLKEQIIQHKTELASLQSDWSNRLSSLQNRYDQEKLACNELQEQFDIMADEKMENDSRLREIEEKERSWKEKYRTLKSQWEERVTLISSLEQSVHQLQEKGRQRHQQIEYEKDQALKEAIESKNQTAHLKQMHKEQLLTQETTMKKRLEDIMKEKEGEVLLAKERVDDMEKEMRGLLEDSAKERKTMEDKFQRLSRTFHELQKELT